MKIKKEFVVPLVNEAIREDLGEGDITSSVIIPSGSQAEAVIVANARGRLCGIGVAELVFKALDRRLKFRALMKDGQLLKKGTRVARLCGRTRSILAGERVSLNLLGRLSGIATLTEAFVKKTRPYSPFVMDTRKTTPGMRYLEKYAVRVGGGKNHRHGLWEWVLIKDNHLRALYSSGEGGVHIVAVLQRAKKKLGNSTTIEIEVDNLCDFKVALEMRPDIIMLDNMNLAEMRKAVRLRNSRWGRRPRLEASGKVDLKNIRGVAQTGVDMISIGALTHSAPSLDFSLEIVSSS